MKFNWFFNYQSNFSHPCGGDSPSATYAPAHNRRIPQSNILYVAWISELSSSSNYAQRWFYPVLDVLSSPPLALFIAKSWAMNTISSTYLYLKGSLPTAIILLDWRTIFLAYSQNLAADQIFYEWFYLLWTNFCYWFWFFIDRSSFFVCFVDLFQPLFFMILKASQQLKYR